MAEVLYDIVTESAKKYPDVPAVRWAEKKNIRDRTYADLAGDSAAVAAYLDRRGFFGSHIALIGTSSYEWIVSYFGIVKGRRTACPMDAALPDDELIDLLNRSDSEALFISPKMKALITKILEGCCPKIRDIYLLDEEPVYETGVESVGNLLHSYVANPAYYGAKKDVADGSGTCDPGETPERDDVATIIFTSGTTGKSKGVQLTHRNLIDNVENVYFKAEPGIVLLSVLPVHHAYCLAMDWLKGLSLGATIAINGSLLHMMKNMQRFQPEAMLMVPLMLETIMKRMNAAYFDALKKAGIRGGETSESADGAKTAGSTENPKVREAKKMIRGKIRETVFGARIRYIFSGGAYLDPFYVDAYKAYGIPVYQGYGMSEVSPVISTNGPEGNRPGTVGRLLPNCEGRIRDGEIQVRGTSVMKGYYKMPEETAEVFTADGWLRTGDLGNIDADGYLTITGRLKNLIILANGENVSPEEIEGTLALDPLIGEIVVSGEKNGLAARIYPDPETVEHDGLSQEGIRSRLQQTLDDYNRTQPTYRALTSLIIRKTPFIKSSTRKIRRNLIDQESENV